MRLTSIQDLISELKKFSQDDVQKLIAELQQKRFDNQGAFNGHEKWIDNKESVQIDKGRNEPLVDSGSLKKQLTNPSNWNLKAQIGTNTMKLSVPQKENFTDKKYDVLDSGGKTNPYISPRGNFIFITSVPARPFKEISDQDMVWIVNNLVKDIMKDFK